MSVSNRRQNTNNDKQATTNESNNQQASLDNNRPCLQNEQINRVDTTTKKTNDPLLLVVSVLVLFAVFFVCRFASSPEPAVSNEQRLMLVGKTGVGKSRTGNTILGEEPFRTEVSPASVTAHCERKNKIVNNKNITVIDTPGVMDTWLMSNKETHNTPSCILDPAHRPHVFLLVIKVGRFTKEEVNAVTWIQTHFGEEALRFTMILFTAGDLLEGKTIEKFISNSVELENLVKLCKSRYHVFNNYDKNNQIQVTELFKKIDQLLYDNLGFTHTKEVVQNAVEKKNMEMDSMLRKKEDEKAQLKEDLEASSAFYYWFTNICIVFFSLTVLFAVLGFLIDKCK